MKPEEMWLYLLPRLKAAFDSGLDPEFVKEFCGVSSRSVRRWVTNENSRPSGVSMVRLWYLLTLIPNTHLPVLHSNPYTDYVAQLTGYGVVSLHEANELFGLNGRPENALMPLRGQQNPVHPAWTLDDLKELREDELIAAQNSWLERLNGFALEEVEQSASELEQADIEVVPDPEVQDEPVPNDTEPEQPELKPDINRPLEAVVSEPEPQPAFPVAPTEVPALVQELPVDLLLKIASKLSALLPSVRYVSANHDAEQIESWLADYFGSDAAEQIATFLGYAVSVEEDDETVAIPEDDETVTRVAFGLKVLAPDIKNLFDDDTPEGAIAREKLRNGVGPEKYSKLTVQMTAMRSRQSYEKAKNNEVN